MSKIYVGDVGTALIIDCGEDLSDITSGSIEIQKPNGQIVIYPAEVYNNNYLKYVIKEGDIDMTGDYKLQSVIVSDSWSGRGETAEFNVSSKFK